MKYIRKFKNHDSHEALKSELEKLGVYLSYCEDQDESLLYYEKPTWITTTYNITHSNQDVNISRYFKNLIKVEIDGVEYQMQDIPMPLLLTLGNHTIRYYVRNPYKLLYQQFRHNYQLKNITLPNTLRILPDFVFDSCWTLQNLSIPDSVEYIGSYAFTGCQSMEFIAIYAGQIKGYDTKSFYRNNDVVLDINDGAFNGLNSSCTIYVYSDMLNIFKEKFPDIADQFEDSLEDWGD